MKNRVIDEVTKDFPQFCQWNRLDQHIHNYSPDIQDEYQKLKSRNNIEGVGTLLSKAKSSVYYEPWTLSMAGHPKIKSMASDFSYIVSCTEKVQMSCPPANNEAIEKAIEKPFRNSSFKVPDYKPINPVKNIAMEKAAACIYLSQESSSECYRNLSKIESFMTINTYQLDQVAIAPYSHGELPVFMEKNKLGFAMGASFDSSLVTAAPVIKGILTDSAATEGLRRAALKMLQQQQKKMNSNSNIFDDLKNSFKEAGLSKNEAESKTWETLGALSATGPNFAKRWSRHSALVNGQKMNLKNIEDNPNAFLLQTIAEAIPKLDTQKSLEHKGQVYSLPAGINFNCDTGKTYHFWMTAYLSRKLVKEGSNIPDATSSAYLADLGYQMNREQYAGKEINLAGTERFNAVENSVRIDLVLSAAGANFGAASAQEKTYSADLRKKVVESMKASPQDMSISALRILPGLPGKAASFFDRIQPKSIFENAN